MAFQPSATLVQYEKSGCPRQAKGCEQTHPFTHSQFTIPPSHVVPTVVQVTGYTVILQAVGRGEKVEMEEQTLDLQLGIIIIIIEESCI